uniref:non-specific serine/threonine protein kinase n=1 Tax=Chaetoceros debilis TaxID=122233 RepID=A0A7S3QH94_9STRA|mmetsp:Transcript_13939/g.20803  ORF Transcript_13939/g.20803 Transcript_13939/m.20803 type:complete len:571 (+) Transcript_13939:111-1823(+)
MPGGADASSGGLGPQLVGEKIAINRRTTSVLRQLGEGGFSFVYLVKDLSEDEQTHGSSSQNESSLNGNEHLVLKITSIHSRQQRDIAEKEAKLLSRLSHPSIVRMFDSCYRSMPAPIPDEIQPRMGMGMGKPHLKSLSDSNTSRPQHLILMEYCEGGTALSVCNHMKQSNTRFDLQSLIIAFGQICNAVSYLHAQRPPIVHRDLKPVNFLVKNGAYKLCDFGSAVFGHVDLRTSRGRSEAEEVIQKTTTQMFRSPEMVDLYMSKKLTQSTDVWALGSCLYSLAFLQNCFEEGSNLAILSRNYKIPDDNPYGEDLTELIDRMLTMNCKERADMTEVILCLSAIYSGRQLPPRKRSSRVEKGEEYKNAKKERVGTYRTDGQGIRKPKSEEKKPAEAKKLNPNSAAARRRKAAQTSALENTIIPLTRQSSKIRKPTTSSTDFDQSFSDGFTFKNDNGGSEFSGVNYPFHVGESNFNDLSQDDLFDFSSENGSGFDNFGSDDGSGIAFRKNTSDRTMAKAVPKGNDVSGELNDMPFESFRVGEDTNRHVPKRKSEAKKKKGINFFGKKAKDVEI